MLVFHVEDDPISQDFVRKVFQAHRYEVITFTNAVDALAQLIKQKPDVLIIDYQLPGGPTGLTLAKQARTFYRELAIIMVSSFAQREEVIEAFRLGVDNFLIKPFSPSELLQVAGDAMFKHHSQSASSESAVLPAGPLEIDLTTRTVLWHGELLDLTRSEYELLVQLALHPGRVFNYAELYALMCGEHLPPTDARSKLRTHVNHLRKKLGQEGRYPHGIQNVHGVGFKWQISPTMPN